MKTMPRHTIANTHLPRGPPVRHCSRQRIMSQADEQDAVGLGLWSQENRNRLGPFRATD